MKKTKNPLNTFHTYTKMKAKGAKNSEIAAKLGISLPTFYNHMKKTKAKETDVKLEKLPFTGFASGGPSALDGVFKEKYPKGQIAEHDYVMKNCSDAGLFSFDEGESESIDPLTRPLLKFVAGNERIKAVLAEELMKHILGL